MSERWLQDIEYIVDTILSGKIEDSWFEEEFFQCTGGYRIPGAKLKRMTKDEARLYAVWLLFEINEYIVDGSVLDLLKKRLKHE